MNNTFKTQYKYSTLWVPSNTVGGGGGGHGKIETVLGKYVAVNHGF